jgi:hypothetical protein
MCVIQFDVNNIQWARWAWPSPGSGTRHEGSRCRHQGRGFRDETRRFTLQVLVEYLQTRDTAEPVVLNRDASDRFICFGHLPNRPCKILQALKVKTRLPNRLDDVKIHGKKTKCRNFRE